MSSFDRDQADKTGVDARTVRRNAERGEKVTPEAMAAGEDGEEAAGAGKPWA